MKKGINKKEAIKIVGINILLAALLFGLVYINKTFFRPSLNDSKFYLNIGFV